MGFQPLTPDTSGAAEIYVTTPWSIPFFFSFVYLFITSNLWRFPWQITIQRTFNSQQRWPQCKWKLHSANMSTKWKKRGWWQLTCSIRVNIPLWVIAPEHEQVMRRPPLFVNCMANEFKFLYMPDALCRTWIYTQKRYILTK